MMDNAATHRRWELWVLSAILLTAAALRLIALADVPPGLRYDELLNYRMAGRVLAGERPLYFAESWGHEPLFHYAQAATIALANASDWSLRLPAAVCGVLSVLTVWLAARRLFGARVAILSAAALAASFWSMFYSRVGLRIVGIAPLSGLMVYFLWRGLARATDRGEKALGDFALAGGCLGGLFYIYMAARVLPLLPLLLALYLLLFHRPAFRRAWLGLLLLVIVAALIAAPLVALLLQQPELEERTQQMTVAWDALKEGDLAPMSRLAVGALGMFLWRGQQDWLYNVNSRPVFDPLTAGCFVLGIVLCLGQWRRPRCAFLLLWLGVGIGPAVIMPPAASLPHAIAAQLPAYVLVAVGIDALWRRIDRLCAWISPLLVVGAIAFHGATSCYAYFVSWANAPEVQELYQSGVTAVARELDKQTDPPLVAIGAPYVNHWHPWNVVAFDLALRRDDLSVRWFDPAGAWVWPAGEGPTVYYFPSDPLGPQAFNPAMKSSLLAELSLTPLAGDGYTFFVARSAVLQERWKALTVPVLAWPPDLAHLPQPALPLVFGDPPAGRFALLGIQMQDEAVSPGGELRLTTYWEVLAADPTPVVAFVHLTSDGLDVWGQYDWLDVWVDGLQPGDRFSQVHPVSVKPDTPPGLYHVQLGLYGPDTLERLPIIADADTQADRVWVAQVRVTE